MLWNISWVEAKGRKDFIGLLRVDIHCGHPTFEATLLDDRDLEIIGVVGWVSLPGRGLNVSFQVGT